MAKPLAGKRAFEAMGRRACSLNLTIHYMRGIRTQWPVWARMAWASGYISQLPHTEEFKRAALNEGKETK